MAYNYSNIQTHTFSLGDEIITVRSYWEKVRIMGYMKLLEQGKIKQVLYEKICFVFNTRQNAKPEDTYKNIYRKPELQVIYSNTAQSKSNTSQYYLPDLCIIKNDNTIYFEEIKGRMDPKSKAHLRNMQRHFPEVKLYVVSKTKKEYKF